MLSVWAGVSDKGSSPSDEAGASCASFTIDVCSINSPVPATINVAGGFSLSKISSASAVYLIASVIKVPWIACSASTSLIFGRSSVELMPK